MLQMARSSLHGSRIANDLGTFSTKQEGPWYTTRQWARAEAFANLSSCQRVWPAPADRDAQIEFYESQFRSVYSPNDAETSRVTVSAMLHFGVTAECDPDERKMAFHAIRLKVRTHPYFCDVDQEYVWSRVPQELTDDRLSTEGPNEGSAPTPAWLAAEKYAESALRAACLLKGDTLALPQPATASLHACNGVSRDASMISAQLRIYRENFLRCHPIAYADKDSVYRLEVSATVAVKIMGEASLPEQVIAVRAYLVTHLRARSVSKQASMASGPLIEVYFIARLPTNVRAHYAATMGSELGTIDAQHQILRALRLQMSSTR